MPRYATPTAPGFYWGKLVHPAANTRDGDEAASADWEVMDVFQNSIEPGDLMVHVPGIECCQDLDAFVWGPEVIRPPELK